MSKCPPLKVKIYTPLQSLTYTLTHSLTFLSFFFGGGGGGGGVTLFCNGHVVDKLFLEDLGGPEKDL